MPRRLLKRLIPTPQHAARPLVPAAVRRAARRPAAVDAASARRDACLRGRTCHLLRAPAGAPAPGNQRGGHLAPQHSGDLRHHLSCSTPSPRCRRTTLAYRVGAALLHVPRQHFKFVPNWHWFGHSLAPVWQAVRRRLHHLRAVRRHHRLAGARPVVALAGDQPLPRPPRHPGGVSLARAASARSPG